jgi:hypothetical protein
MPYASMAQDRFFHAAEKRGEIKASTVKEYDKATNFKNLPARVGKKRRRPRLAEYVK